jgi:hypothetical protein
MSNDLRKEDGYAYKGVWYGDERQANLVWLGDEEAGQNQPQKAVRYADGSVIVMDDQNIVVDNFTDNVYSTPIEQRYEER